MKKILDLDKMGLKKFGTTMAIAFLVITALIFFKHKYSIVPTLTISLLFFILAFTLYLYFILASSTERGECV